MKIRQNIYIEKDLWLKIQAEAKKISKKGVYKSASKIIEQHMEDYFKETT